MQVFIVAFSERPGEQNTDLSAKIPEWNALRVSRTCYLVATDADIEDVDDRMKRILGPEIRICVLAVKRPWQAAAPHSTKYWLSKNLEW